MATFVLLLGTSIYFIYDYYSQAVKQTELYDNLADMVDFADESYGETEPILYSEDKAVLPEFAGLYLKKSDLVG